MEAEREQKKRLEAENEGKPQQEEDEGVVHPPDGGWGWAVVAGSFLCNAIVDGIIFSFGLLLPQMADDLSETRGRLFWAGSLLAGFYLIAGPVVSGLANTYGCRPVAIAGTLLASISFALASLSPNLEFLCMTFGVAGGIGFGFIYLPAVVTVGFYFDRRRAFATGLAVCGSGFGTFAVAPLVQLLLNRFAWRGTLLVLSGLILHCVVFGALFRPLRPVQRDSKPLLERMKEAREKGRWGSKDSVQRVAVSLPELSSILSKNISSVCHDYSPPPSYSEVVEADHAFPIYITTPSPTSHRRRQAPFHDSFHDINRPFFRKDILYSASLLHLPEFKSQPDIRQYTSSVTNIPEMTSSKMAVLQETFKRMLDLSLLRSPTFMLLCLGGFLTLAGFFVPFVFLVDRAVKQGIPAEQATFLLPAIGLTNTIGRVFSGWASDRFDALSINNAALIIGGLLTILNPFMTSFPVLICYGALFGFSIACFATLRSIILVDLLGLDKLTNAFGLLLLFQGLASIVGSPIAGMFYDATGSYDASFYIAGSVIFLSGLLGLPLRRLSLWEKNRNLRRQQNVICMSIKEAGTITDV